jgi:hypothetical protein
MRLRPIIVLAAMSVGFAGLAVAATLRQVIPNLDVVEFSYEGVVDQVAIDEYYTWLQSGWVYYDQTPWLVTSAVIAGVAALALAAYRAQRRIQDQAGSASATASRDTARS